ncbi:reverse transcriptase-like protein [Candidatus Gracilibacteria bacterium]|nr:reverse transcriptase-like protein [Candidatus Gracilibacteria bacterium]
MKLKIYTDGGARGNPGNAGIGVYITDENGREIEKRYKNIGIKTNNDAEYTAVYLALTRAVELGYKDIDLFSDSSLVVNQLSSNRKIKEDRLKIYKADIDKIIKENKLKVSFNWIKREDNKEADRLSNVAMDEKK